MFEPAVVNSWHVTDAFDHLTICCRLNIGLRVLIQKLSKSLEAIYSLTVRNDVLAQ